MGRLVVELRRGKVAEKVDCLLLERQYTSLGNKLAVRRKRSTSADITRGAVKTPSPTLVLSAPKDLF